MSDTMIGYKITFLATGDEISASFGSVRDYILFYEANDIPVEVSKVFTYSLPLTPEEYMCIRVGVEDS